MDKFNFDKVIQKMEQSKSMLPVLLANQAQRYFVDTFQRSGWDGKLWQTPKRMIPGTPEYKYPKNKGLSRQTSPILVRTGKLRRAVNESIRETTFSRIRLVVALPYAKYLNDGTDKMVQRKFIGDSPILRRVQIQKIDQEIMKIWV